MKNGPFHFWRISNTRNEHVFPTNKYCTNKYCIKWNLWKENISDVVYETDFTSFSYISSDVDIYLVLYYLHEKYIKIFVSNIVTFYDQNESLSSVLSVQIIIGISDNPPKFHCKVFQNETACWNAGVTILNPSYLTLSLTVKQ